MTFLFWVGGIGDALTCTFILLVDKLLKLA